MWIYRTVSNANHALFSKDRGDANSAAMNTYLYIGSDNRIKANIANGDDATTCTSYSSSGTVPDSSWKYIVFGATNINGYQVSLETWINTGS